MSQIQPGWSNEKARKYSEDYAKLVGWDKPTPLSERLAKSHAAADKQLIPASEQNAAERRKKYEAMTPEGRKEYWENAVKKARAYKEQLKREGKENPLDVKIREARAKGIEVDVHGNPAYGGQLLGIKPGYEYWKKKQELMSPRMRALENIQGGARGRVLPPKPSEPRTIGGKGMQFGFVNRRRFPSPFYQQGGTSAGQIAQTPVAAPTPPAPAVGPGSAATTLPAPLPQPVANPLTAPAAQPAMPRPAFGGYRGGFSRMRRFGAMGKNGFSRGFGSGYGGRTFHRRPGFSGGRRFFGGGFGGYRTNPNPMAPGASAPVPPATTPTVDAAAQFNAPAPAPLTAAGGLTQPNTNAFPNNRPMAPNNWSPERNAQIAALPNRGRIPRIPGYVQPPYTFDR